MADYLATYNLVTHHNALRKAPYEKVQALWESRPRAFRDSPGCPASGTNTSNLRSRTRPDTRHYSNGCAAGAAP